MNLLSKFYKSSMDPFKKQISREINDSNIFRDTESKLFLQNYIR